MAADDTEITLGVGKLLGLFFMLAATCGIFFAVGYSLGKTSAREQAMKNATAQSESADAEPVSAKPAPAPAMQTSAVPAAESEAAKATAPDLTFYKSLKQNPREEAGSAQGMKSPGAAAGAGKSVPMTKPTESPSAGTMAAGNANVSAKAESAASSMPATPQTSASGTYLVQIAAVSHEEDAAALAGALRKKSYAAAVVNSPNGKDKLFHVVLGPYASLQDAEAMKLKLQGEGYNPIVKR